MKLRCSICKKWRELYDFHRSDKDHRGRVYGVAYVCADCIAEYGANYREVLSARSDSEMAKDMPERKLCPDCGVDLPAAAFGLCRAKRTGLQTYCREHQNERSAVARARYRR
jgi:hypothetical protein